MENLSIHARGQWNSVNFDANVQEITKDSIISAISNNMPKCKQMQQEEIGANIVVFIKGTLNRVATGFITFFGISGLHTIDVTIL